MSDEDKIEKPSGCVRRWRKIRYTTAQIAEKMAEALNIGSTTYGNYRRGLCFVVARQRPPVATGYRPRDIAALPQHRRNVSAGSKQVLEKTSVEKTPQLLKSA